jgi:hypothetical protein
MKKRRKEKKTKNYDKISSDVWVEILCYLNIHKILDISLINKTKWYQLCHIPYIWKMKYIMNIGNIQKKQKVTKKYYKKHHTKLKNLGLNHSIDDIFPIYIKEGYHMSCRYMTSIKQFLGFLKYNYLYTLKNIKPLIESFFETSNFQRMTMNNSNELTTVVNILRNDTKNIELFFKLFLNNLSFITNIGDFIDFFYFLPGKYEELYISYFLSSKQHFCKIFKNIYDFERIKALTLKKYIKGKMIIPLIDVCLIRNMDDITYLINFFNLRQEDTYFNCLFEKFLCTKKNFNNLDQLYKYLGNIDHFYGKSCLEHHLFQNFTFYIKDSSDFLKAHDFNFTSFGFTKKLKIHFVEYMDKIKIVTSNIVRCSKILKSEKIKLWNIALQNFLMEKNDYSDFYYYYFGLCIKHFQKVGQDKLENYLFEHFDTLIKNVYDWQDIYIIIKRKKDFNKLFDNLGGYLKNTHMLKDLSEFLIQKEEYKYVALLINYVMNHLNHFINNIIDFKYLYNFFVQKKKYDCNFLLVNYVVDHLNHFIHNINEFKELYNFFMDKNYNIYLLRRYFIKEYNSLICTTNIFIDMYRFFKKDEIIRLYLKEFFFEFFFNKKLKDQARINDVLDMFEKVEKDLDLREKEIKKYYV